MCRFTSTAWHSLWVVSSDKNSAAGDKIVGKLLNKLSILKCREGVAETPYIGEDDDDIVEIHKS